MAEHSDQRLADFKDNAAGALATIAANNTAIGVSRSPELEMGANKSHSAAIDAAKGVGSELRASLDAARQQQSAGETTNVERFANRGNSGQGRSM